MSTFTINTDKLILDMLCEISLRRMYTRTALIHEIAAQMVEQGAPVIGSYQEAERYLESVIKEMTKDG